MVAASSGQRAAEDSIPAAVPASSTAYSARPALRRVPRREKGLQLPLIADDDLPTEAATDRLPEQTHYRDEGCELWHACLSCPFTRCILDIPGGPKRILRLFRNAEARRLFDAGARIDEIAAELGMARRTVYNALGGARRRERGSRESGVGSRGGMPKSRTHTARREGPRLPTPDSRLPRD